MDNKAYLDQIAVKGKVKSGPIFTPVLIKLIAAGVVMFITMIIVGSVISSSNAKVAQSHEHVYMRITNLGNDSSSSNPLKAYSEKLRDSDLRGTAKSLMMILTATKNNLSGMASAIGVDPSAISPEVSKIESTSLSSYSAALEDAVLAGTLDRTFASETYMQIATLISYETESMKKSNNQAYVNLLNQSIADLTKLQEQFMVWSDSH